jgi:hypothetical protein
LADQEVPHQQAKPNQDKGGCQQHDSEALEFDIFSFCWPPRAEASKRLRIRKPTRRQLCEAREYSDGSKRDHNPVSEQRRVSDESHLIHQSVAYRYQPLLLS